MAQSTAVDRTGVTHLVVLNEDNEAVLVKCHRIRPRAIGGLVPTARPSCPACARLFDQEVK